MEKILNKINFLGKILDKIMYTKDKLPSQFEILKYNFFRHGDFGSGIDILANEY